MPISFVRHAVSLWDELYFVHFFYSLYNMTDGQLIPHPQSGLCIFCRQFSVCSFPNLFLFSSITFSSLNLRKAKFSGGANNMQEILLVSKLSCKKTMLVTWWSVYTALSKFPDKFRWLKHKGRSGASRELFFPLPLPHCSCVVTSPCLGSSLSEDSFVFRGVLRCNGCFITRYHKPFGWKDQCKLKELTNEEH